MNHSLPRQNNMEEATLRLVLFLTTRPFTACDIYGVAMASLDGIALT